MKAHAIFLILGLGTLAASAQVPSQPTPSRYARLSSDSPFTSKPLPPTQEAKPDILENWALGGITKLKDGYYTILIDKKDPTKRELVGQGELKTWSVEEVTYSDEGWRGTKVKIRAGGEVGELEFDDKLVAVKAAVAPKLPPGAQPPQPGAAPGQAQPQPQGARPPRPRVVVPSTQQNPSNNSNTSNRGGQRPSVDTSRFQRGRGR